MFCFFIKDKLVDFWSNRIGDVFCSSTIKNMKWNLQEVDLVFYTGIDSIPEHYELDSNKKLIVKKRHINQVELLDENEEPVLDEKGNPMFKEVISFTVEKEIEPDFFMSKGLMIKLC